MVFYVTVDKLAAIVTPFKPGFAEREESLDPNVSSISSLVLVTNFLVICLYFLSPSNDWKRGGVFELFSYAVFVLLSRNQIQLQNLGWNIWIGQSSTASFQL
jgi:hypothetical protein